MHIKTPAEEKAEDQRRRRIEKYLDAGHGACVLQRYDLIAYVPCLSHPDFPQNPCSTEVSRMIEYTKFQKALKHLELQYENYKNLDYTLPEITQEAVAESVIQRFETCYDCLWKVLKRYLSEELGLPELPNSPKPIFRIAAENQLFSSSIVRWLNYADARIATSHDYSGEKADAALAVIEYFIDDAIGLYQTMSADTWE